MEASGLLEVDRRLSWKSRPVLALRKGWLRCCLSLGAAGCICGFATRILHVVAQYIDSYAYKILVVSFSAELFSAL